MDLGNFWGCWICSLLCDGGFTVGYMSEFMKLHFKYVQLIVCQLYFFKILKTL